MPNDLRTQDYICLLTNGVSLLCLLVSSTVALYDFEHKVSRVKFDSIISALTQLALAGFHASFGTKIYLTAKYERDILTVFDGKILVALPKLIQCIFGLSCNALGITFFFLTCQLYGKSVRRDLDSVAAKKILSGKAPRVFLYTMLVSSFTSLLAVLLTSNQAHWDFLTDIIISASELINGVLLVVIFIFLLKTYAKIERSATTEYVRASCFRLQAVALFLCVLVVYDAVSTVSNMPLQHLHIPFDDPMWTRISTNDRTTFQAFAVSTGGIVFSLLYLSKYFKVTVIKMRSAKKLAPAPTKIQMSRASTASE